MGRGGFDPLGPGVIPGSTTGDGFDSVEVGRVKKTTAAGATFVLPGSPAHAWGPARWSLGGYDTAQDALDDGYGPRVGDTCLVAYAGSDHEPWILAWWR
ncbi:hypothetical protein [Kineosporia succinea]|uniref:Uncharacterized protein n=1 Tax=Kineosporia succinea TaxID=84632 RepID=A0ABT9PBQ3_9ACTN|nr:hypothetical protein [Kineosporia succinea]MDP9829445.1 hypothetical protein [Kineosporia succinea]